jgi:hypothetical protein
LKAILKDAQRRGKVVQNVAAGVSITVPTRDKQKLKIGQDIPSRQEIDRIVDAAKDPGCVKTQKSATCEKYNSPTRT